MSFEIFAGFLSETLFQFPVGDYSSDCSYLVNSNLLCGNGPACVGGLPICLLGESLLLSVPPNLGPEEGYNS